HVLTRRVQRVSMDRVLRQAIDVERGAPLGGGTTGARRPLYIARWVELQFHERRAGVVGKSGDVRVTVSRAVGAHLWVGLGVAQGHTQPECRMELEVPRLVVRGGIRDERRGVGGEDQLPLVAIAGPRRV